jgi:hypothetical protein
VRERDEVPSRWCVFEPSSATDRKRRTQSERIPSKRKKSEKKKPLPKEPCSPLYITRGGCYTECGCIPLVVRGAGCSYDSCERVITHSCVAPAMREST